MGVGFQSHVGAQEGYYVPKAQLETTFARLNALGVEALITEMDLWIQANDTINQRYQAAIWGDYVDACLYAENCNEFISWVCLTPALCRGANSVSLYPRTTATTPPGSSPATGTASPWPPYVPLLPRRSNPG
jgi:hypothetical protein